MCRIIYVSFSLQRWVREFRMDRFDVKLHTNNGVERQNRCFKYGFLADNRDKTLSGWYMCLSHSFFQVHMRSKSYMDRFSNPLKYCTLQLPKNSRVLEAILFTLQDKTTAKGMNRDCLLHVLPLTEHNNKYFILVKKGIRNKWIVVNIILPFQQKNPLMFSPSLLHLGI